MADFHILQGKLEPPTLIPLAFRTTLGKFNTPRKVWFYVCEGKSTLFITV